MLGGASAAGERLLHANDAEKLVKVVALHCFGDAVDGDGSGFVVLAFHALKGVGRETGHGHGFAFGVAHDDDGGCRGGWV